MIEICLASKIDMNLFRQLIVEEQKDGGSVHIGNKLKDDNTVRVDLREGVAAKNQSINMGARDRIGGGKNRKF